MYLYVCNVEFGDDSQEKQEEEDGARNVWNKRAYGQDASSRSRRYNTLVAASVADRSLGAPTASTLNQSH